MANDDLTRTAGLYRAFREAHPANAQRYPFRKPKALARLGTVEFVGYMTTHGGRVALYVHYFAPGSRPGLYATTGRSELYLLGGRFSATGLGITDTDINGRVVDYRPRFEVRLVREEERRTLHNRRRRRKT